MRALSGINLSVDSRTIVGVTGDNGAGKSTLLKVIAGAVNPDSGTLSLRGVRRQFSSPNDARRHGIEIVYQELALAPDLDVVENAFLGREIERKWFGLRTGHLDRRRMESIVEERLHDLDFRLDSLSQEVSELSGGQRQAVAIVRALSSNPSVIVLDEPTAALSEAKIPSVLALLRKLRDRGVAVLIVSHRIQDLLDVSDRIVVIGAGIVILDEVASKITLDTVVSAMVSAPSAVQ